MSKADNWDAFGRYLMDVQQGCAGPLIIERDDGYLDLDRCDYFYDYEQWSPEERAAIDLAGRRVVDVGCGAGRVCLHLQRRGVDVLGIDLSAMAIRTSRQRGVKRLKRTELEQLDRELADRDTIILFGNNLGLLGTPARGRMLLKRWAKRTPAECRIIASCIDPRRTKLPEHLAYHRWNRRRGRPVGQIRIRVRYRARRSPWFELLFLGPAELRTLVRGTGWRVERILRGAGSGYACVLTKVTAIEPEPPASRA